MSTRTWLWEAFSHWKSVQQNDSLRDGRPYSCLTSSPSGLPCIAPFAPPPSVQSTSTRLVTNVGHIPFTCSSVSPGHIVSSPLLCKILTELECEIRLACILNRSTGDHLWIILYFGRFDLIARSSAALASAIDENCLILTVFAGIGDSPQGKCSQSR